MSSRKRKSAEKAARVGSPTEMARGLHMAMQVQVLSLKALGCPFEDPRDILEWGARHGGLVSICEAAGQRIAKADAFAKRLGYCVVCYNLPGVCKCLATPHGIVPTPAEPKEPGVLIATS